LALVNAVKGPQRLKKEYFQKIKLTPQSTSVPNFNMTRPFLTLLGFPKVFGHRALA